MMAARIGKLGNLLGLAPGMNFTKVLHEAFTLIDPESVKNVVKSSVSFYAFGICACKSCM